MVSGCGADLFVNICLTLLGYIPGHIHAFYIEYVYFDRKDRARTGQLTGQHAPGKEPHQTPGTMADIRKKASTAIACRVVGIKVTAQSRRLHRPLALALLALLHNSEAMECTTRHMNGVEGGTNIVHDKSNGIGSHSGRHIAWWRDGFVHSR